MEDGLAVDERVTATSPICWQRLGGSCLLALLVLFSWGLAACGGSTKRAAQPTPNGPRSSSAIAATPAGSSSVTRAAAASPFPAGDQDGDSREDKAYDKDDGFMTTFGHPAAPGDATAITSLVKRYYAAIAKADGVGACKLLFFVVAESAAEVYGQTGTNVAAGRGKSCGSVLSKVFQGSHRQLVAENRNLKVIGVRVLGRRVLVLLRFGPLSVRTLVVYREGDSWKVGELLDTRLG